MEPDVTTGAPEFLLAEYEHLGTSYWKNEETGDKRFNFFITLVTAVLAACVALATEAEGISGGEMRAVTAAACAGLLLLGLSTLMRMLRRNRAADRYKDGLDRVRKRFRELDRRLEGYDPGLRVAGEQGRRLGGGGLAETVAMVNGLIVAVLVASAALPLHKALVAVLAGGAFVIAVVLQLGYVLSFYRRADS